MRSMLTIFAALSLVAGGAPALAAPCKDAKTGRFIKCAEKAPVKPVKCRDAKGKFAKCGTQGAKPAK